MHTTRPQCATACQIPNRHQPDCDGTNCTGCLPGLAADGLLLCRHHTRLIGEHVLTIAARHRQIGAVLAGATRPGEKVRGGTRNPNISLNLRAAAVRRDIDGELHRLTRLICRERGFAWPTEARPPIVAKPAYYGFIGPLPLVHHQPHPTDRVPPIARVVARSSTWLAGHPAAGTISERLTDLNRRAYAVAFPSGTRVFELPGLNGERLLACPERVDDGVECPGNLWTILRRDGDRLPAQIMCNHDDEHQWPAQQWMKLGRRMLRAQAQQVAA
jgi:hypothetical protein